MRTLRRAVITFTIVFGVGLALLVWFGLPESLRGSDRDLSKLRVGESMLSTNTDEVRVTGTIVNDDTRRWSHCGIEVQVEDREGRLLQVFRGSHRGLAPGETAEFVVTTDRKWPEEDHGRHAVVIVTGW
ncbi:MAG: FxLYD domain-containing protein [Acidobacteriota bacterium]